MISGKPLLYMVTALNALSFLMIGWDNGVIGGLTGSTPWNDTFKTAKDPALLGLIVAIYEIGCFLGAMACVVLGERLGRKVSIRVGAVIMIIGAVLQTAPTKGSHPVAMMIAARIISGIGMGFINSTAPVLQAEVSPAATRGRYVCAQLSTLNAGIMATYWVDSATVKAFPTSTIAWRLPIALQLVFLLPILALTFMIPESPRWLASHDRLEECHSVVARYAGLPEDDETVLARYNEIADSVAYEKSVTSSSWSQIFRKDRISSRRRFFIACSIQGAQQLGGINGIIYFAFFIFNNSLGFKGDEAGLLAGGLFTWFFIASFIPWFLIDSLGRRPLLIAGVAIMATVFAVMGGLLSQVEAGGANANQFGAGAAALAFVYMGTFTTCFQATVWVYPPEILPLSIRAKGTAAATATNWIVNFAVVYVMPILITNLGYKTYFVFFCFNAAFVPLFYIFYPETKGKTLEEIDAIFDQSHGVEDVNEIKMDSRHVEKVDLEHNEK